MVNVAVVNDAGLMGSEKVAVGDMPGATPVAPGVGVRAVMVGGVRIAPTSDDQLTRATASSALS